MIIPGILFLALLSPFAVYLIVLGFSRNEKKEKLGSGSNKITGLSVILPCYNEFSNIERKIQELLAECAFLSDFEIIIIDDNSTDSTPQLLEKFYHNKNIRQCCLKERSGKANALNKGIEMAAFDIIVFSDARQIIKRGSIAHLIDGFSDENVGAVSARLINGHNKSAIRSMINYLKTLESKTGHLTGVYGALYAIRKFCYKKIPCETILDDLLISLQIIAQKKYVKIENRAIVYDLDICRFYSKNRTIRIIQGLMQMLREHFRLIMSLPLRVQLYLFCQKYFKLFAPLIFLIIAITALFIDLDSSFILFIPGIFIIILTLGFKESKLLFFSIYRLFISIIKPHKTNSKWEKLKG
jgi:cellulose synthase/poly-beta-1,6-N-acetylglucosamine synthase-like glycosyltransferase